MTLVPIADSAGRASSKSAAAPPTMIASVPSVARGVPPDTGASMKRTPRSCAALATRCETAGSMVDMSTPASVRDYTTSAQDTARSAVQGDGWGTATNALATVNAALGAIPVAGLGVTLARKMFSMRS